MSEVKIYLINPMYVAKAKGDPGKFDYLMSRMVMERDFDAQRLRADTAEAELKREKEFHAANVSELERKLTAVDHRISDHLKLIGGLIEYADNLLSDVNSAWQYAGSTGNPETHRDPDYVAAVAMIAALNQKSEGGSNDGKPAIGSVVVVHGGIKAFVKAHHKDGLIVGAGDGHLVTEWRKP